MKKSTLGIIVTVIAIAALASLLILTNRKQAVAPSIDDIVSADLEAGQPADIANEAGDQAAKTSTVEINNFAFSPATIKIKKGTTVTWTNRDTAEHTVTPDVDGAFKGSALFGKNQSYSVTFNTVGTFGYFCQPHPYMTATVIVEE